ncbi:MAG: T9SS type A sorting domain-containing protein, partial [Bacteroidales bacterium]|nr:T9SS type A sorting domain-containing protein [Bacteroidales bacterium]
KLLFGYLNLSLRAQGEYDDAIYNYESILLNDPTYNDSVFAVINIGNTYLEAQGNYKSVSGIFGYLRPDSETAHSVKTKKLLLSLRDETPILTFEYPESEHILGQNYPNPHNNTTRIDIYLAERSNAKLQIFSPLGILVDELQLNTRDKGSYTIEYTHPNLKDGVYYYSLEVDGLRVGTKKMIVRK